ncbi:MAG: hypothetical protein AB1489_06020 [Acidobacteriota bacterium]
MRRHMIMVAIVLLSSFLVLMLKPVFSQSANNPAQVKIEDLFKANRYNLVISNGSLSGSGLDFLIKAASTSQFFAIGEPHNTKDVPEITSLLFESLHKQYGFNYIALEQDPVMAQMVSAPSVVGKRDYVISLARQYPNAFIFITDQELEMISRTGVISNGKGNRIWGVDQVFGAIHVLDRLSKFAPNAEIRDRTLKLIEVLKQHEAERVKKLQRYTMADVGEIDEFNNLIRQYNSKGNSEVEFLISQMLLSAQIYKNNIMAEAGQLTGYISNLEREENMKTLFMLEYRKAQAAGEALPKVLLKFGHYHSIRGKNLVNVFTLGNFVAELAKSNSMGSFHLTIYNNNTSGDYQGLADIAEYKPLASAAEGNLTIIDLRPLRGYIHAGRVSGLNPELKSIIFGFDAVLLIKSVSGGTYKLIGVE